VAVPRQRNTDEAKARIKAGEKAVQIWPTKPAKPCQKDTEARWTVKFRKARPDPDGKPQSGIAIPTYGYKSHISIDRRHGVIRWSETTDAAAHDGARLREGPIDPNNTASGVWADTAYRSAENERYLADIGKVSRIHRRKPPGRPLPRHHARANAAKSAVRAHVAPPFADQKGVMGLVIRTIGLARAHATITLANMAYNMKRWCWLDRRGLPASAIRPNGTASASMPWLSRPPMPATDGHPNRANVNQKHQLRTFTRLSKVSRWFRLISCRRATRLTKALGSWLSSTIRVFSAALQRRRRCTEVITSTFSGVSVIRTVILLTLPGVGTGPGQFGGRFRSAKSDSSKAVMCGSWASGGETRGGDGVVTRQAHAQDLQRRWRPRMAKDGCTGRAAVPGEHLLHLQATRRSSGGPRQGEHSRSARRRATQGDVGRA
jgi:hypothetical protein